MHFCPCCATPWPTNAQMEACHQRCLDKRRNDAHATETQPKHDPTKN